MNSGRYLAQKAAELIRENFKNETIDNLLLVRWSDKPWLAKFGHIKPFKSAEFGSLIEINCVLNDPRVPEFVVDATLLHELIHYFDGFASNKKRLRRHPHRGNVMKKEFEKFGWTELASKQDEWVKKNFEKLYDEKKRKQKMRHTKITKKNANGGFTF